MGGFEHFAHRNTSVAITGHVYHRIFDIAHLHHSLHWFIHDKAARTSEGIIWNVPLHWIWSVHSDLLHVNPYLDQLQCFHDTYPTDNASLKILNTTTTPDFAVLFHASNTTEVWPYSICYEMAD